MNFSFFYKESFNADNIAIDEEYDVFISSFDGCERTTKLYDKIKSKEKIWLIFPHYHISTKEYPSANFYFRNIFKEDDFFQEFFEKYRFEKTQKISIDCTGFIKPHLLYLLNFFSSIIQVAKIDFFYTEPVRYLNADETSFSGFIEGIRLVEGYSAYVLNSDTKNDVLIISAGYDDNLISRVCQYKSYCKNKYYILGFPSLQPDMYQESILKVHRVKESTGEIKSRFAPAYDPFVTADVLTEIVDSIDNFTNIYISPLATKPQTLGFALYFLWNRDKPINILYPYSKTYSSKNALGMKKIWRYTLELPNI